MSRSESKSHSRRRSQSPRQPQRNKLFVTNLDGSANERELETELRELFEKHGSVTSLEAKKSRNGEYCFAFVVYAPGEDGEEAVRNLNGHQVRGKPMKVELQDNAKRRKDPDKGCYLCGKKGHFARECRSKNSSRSYRDHSRSDSYERRRSKHRRRSYSASSERDRSRTKKKDRKHKDEKKKKKQKKQKKHRNRSSSGSRS